MFLKLGMFKHRVRHYLFADCFVPRNDGRATRNECATMTSQHPRYMSWHPR
jgi:hypothetical protein